MEEKYSSKGFWYSELNTIDRDKGERGYRRIGRESHREGWSGANETLNVLFLLHNLSCSHHTVLNSKYFTFSCFKFAEK